MNLNQAEIIQILRKRAGMNQGEFGAKAFSTSFQAGRTKIKNIELGKQVPTDEDLEKMAPVLKIPATDLKAGDMSKRSGVTDESTPTPSPSVLTHFPGLDVYLDLLNKAATLDDVELIDHIAAKLCELLVNRKRNTYAVPS